MKNFDLQGNMNVIHNNEKRSNRPTYHRTDYWGCPKRGNCQYSKLKCLKKYIRTMNNLGPSKTIENLKSHNIPSHTQEISDVCDTCNEISLLNWSLKVLCKSSCDFLRTTSLSYPKLATASNVYQSNMKIELSLDSKRKVHECFRFIK